VESTVGRAMAQAVISRPVTADAQLQSRTSPVTLVMDMLAIGLGFLQVLRYSPVSIIAQTVHTHPFYYRRYIILPTNSVINSYPANVENMVSS
jgi:hypothetical protein